MDMGTNDLGDRLIPPPELVRAELARSIRESRRLRALLRLALLTEDDRRFLAELRRHAPQAAPKGQGGAR